VLREAVFYSYVNQAGDKLTVSSQMLHKPPPSSIPRAKVNYESKSQIVFTMPYGGKPLHKTPMQSKSYLQTLFRQLLEALEWLHARGWCHNDLKPSNIVVLHDKLMLVDYGSISFHPLIPPVYQRCTIYYVAPEQLEKLSSCCASDMWSFGAVFFEMIVHKTFLISLMTFMKLSEDEIATFKQHAVKENKESYDVRKYLKQFYERVMYSDILHLLQHHIKDRKYLDILSFCLLKDPKQRASASELLHKPNGFLYFPGHYCSVVEDTFWSSLHDTHLRDMSSIKTYKIARHASFAFSDRQRLLTKMIEICKTHEEIGEEVFFHALMLFDRYSFRYFTSIQSSYDVVLGMALCIFISGILLRGTYITLENLSEMINNPLVSADLIKHHLFKMMEGFQMMLWNATPEYLHFIKTKQATLPLSVEQSQATISTALSYPWLHPNILAITNTIFEPTKKEELVTV